MRHQFKACLSILLEDEFPGFSRVRLGIIVPSGGTILDTCGTQRYNWVMIPSFDWNGNLPPGIHQATLSEIENRFAGNATRKRLFEALSKVVNMFQECQCQGLYLDGSFITNKQEPNDYDLCWEPTGIEPKAELKEFLMQRENRKELHLGDIFQDFHSRLTALIIL